MGIGHLIKFSCQSKQVMPTQYHPEAGPFDRKISKISSSLRSRAKMSRHLGPCPGAKAKKELSTLFRLQDGIEIEKRMDVAKHVLKGTMNNTAHPFGTSNRIATRFSSQVRTEIPDPLGISRQWQRKGNLGIV